MVKKLFFRNTQHQQQTYQAAGRYIKNNHAGPQSNGNIQPSNGWQKRIIRRQSQVASEAIEASLPKLESSTTPRHWKIGQSNEQESPIQKKAPTHFEAGEFVDESGQVYKSMGESIIAKEIREYREREEELRRSRSQLGLPSLEDMLDDYKNNVKGGKAERSHSVDHLQVSNDFSGHKIGKVHMAIKREFKNKFATIIRFLKLSVS